MGQILKQKDSIVIINASYMSFNRLVHSRSERHC